MSFNKNVISHKTNIENSNPKNVEHKKNKKFHQVFFKNYCEMFENYEVFNIESTSLNCMSYDEMKKLSVCKINSGTNKKTEDNTPSDSRLGYYSEKTIKTKNGPKIEICSTCHQQKDKCPGHNGLIDLNYYFINPLFTKYAKYVLNSVCNSCSLILIDKNTLEDQNILNSQGVARLKKISDKCTNLSCKNPKCMMKDYKRNYFKTNSQQQLQTNARNNNHKILYSINNVENEIQIDEIENIFNEISKSDLKLLGFTDNNNPSNFILKGLLVIPKCIRPPTIYKGEKPDHITMMYDKIIKSNNDLLITTLSQDEKDNKIRDLYTNISCFFDNKNGTCISSTKETIKSITQRFCEKDGIIRGQAMGKRVDYFIRTIAGPGYACDFDCLKVPNLVSNILTKTIPVIKHNYDFVINVLWKERKIVNICKKQELESNIFSRPNVSTVNYSSENPYLPEIGDLLEVICEDDDDFLINRQPSLHKNSIMGVKARLTEFLNFGLHSSHTTPLNADFDGDEINGYKIQTIGARIEARHLVDVGSCIMNAQVNGPTMGLVFNCPNSAYLMSNPDIMIDPDDWKNAIKRLKDNSRLLSLEKRLKYHSIKMYSGMALFSSLLPEDFYYNHDKILIKNGILLKGRLAKKHIGTSTNSIIQVLWKNYNKETTVRFFTEGQLVLDWFLEYHGFSIGYSSCVGEIDSNIINNYIDNEIWRSTALIDSLPALDENSTPFQKKYNESQICVYLKNLENLADKFSKDALSKNNDFLTMVNSGAKGNMENIVKILGMLGQIFVYGKRPKMDLNNITRCNTYCVKDSKNLKYRGFCKSSFMNGLDPLELFFHLMASRCGLIDTAIMTADTGSLHHRINKNFEDILSCYDGSVRSVNGKIIQFSYNDGFDASNLVPVKSEILGGFCSFIDLGNIIGKLNNEIESENIID